MARGGPLCCPPRSCHVSAIGPRPSLACLWGQCRARPPLLGLSWDTYVEWSEAELGKPLSPTRLYLIRVSSPRLSSDPFGSPDRTFTTTTPFNYNQFSPRTSHCPLVIFRAHPSPLFGPLLFGFDPAALPFRHTYLEYLHATNTVEHVLFAFAH